MKQLLLLIFVNLSYCNTVVHHKVLKNVTIPETSILCIKEEPKKPYDIVFLTLGGFISGMGQFTPQKNCEGLKTNFGLELHQGDRFLGVLEDQKINIQTKDFMIKINASEIIEINNLGHIFEIKTNQDQYLGFIINEFIDVLTPFQIQNIPVTTLKSYTMPSSHKEKSFMELNSFWDPIFSSVFFLKKAGEFEMGKNTQVPIFLDEAPAHKVTISQDFYIARHEVTVEDWLKIMPDNNFPLQDDCLKCPISNANWNQVDQFIQKLNTMQNQVVYSLPTEAEWEFVASPYEIEEKTPKDKFNNVCEYQDKNLFCDLFSGVWEWTKDNKSTYTKDHVTDPLVLTDSKRKIYRGGSNFSQKRVRNHSYRGSASTSKNDHTIGFRLVLRRR
ncbi:MAG: SUMF1/EgtB/PvdO family nonheme iron enzyme [Candidatus Cloacimonetes bacterium]|nr:SUMF1/EgtB/PvdO family nonheme iron enzyme [Candidatus Cloacimonadota bacterium]